MSREIYRRLTKALVWIVVALGLLLFALNAIWYWINLPRPGRHVPQQAQFHSIEAALELFNNEFDGYPPSDGNDPAGKPYCGAMKFAEAMMGRDLLGFHSKSVFRVDRKDANGVAELYNPTDLTSRKGPYLPPESADCLTLADIYGRKSTGPFDPNLRVVCDVFRQTYKSGKKAGMPILYYKADTSKTAHDIDNPNNPNNPNNIYDYHDNHALLALGVPGEPEKKHPLFTDPGLFYRMTKSDKVPNESKPFKAETYIVLSAGKDGLYGTPDDICNFEFDFPQQQE